MQAGSRQILSSAPSLQVRWLCGNRRVPIYFELSDGGKYLVILQILCPCRDAIYRVQPSRSCYTLTRSIQPRICPQLDQYGVAVAYQYLNLAQPLLGQFHVFERLGQDTLLDGGIGFSNFGINRAAY